MYAMISSILNTASTGTPNSSLLTIHELDYAHELGLGVGLEDLDGLSDCGAGGEDVVDDYDATLKGGTDHCAAFTVLRSQYKNVSCCVARKVTRSNGVDISESEPQRPTGTPTVSGTSL
jgi:hypothetical protein